VKARAAIALGAVALLLAIRFARTNPTPCPYGLRWMLELPRPGISRERVLEVLAPSAGERILELGPGTGHYTLEVARRLEGGRLDALDIQQEMLDDLASAAERDGIANVVPALGDARTLPFGDGSFDAALMVTVLGEIPDQGAALLELARVLRPGGRLVVGETAIGGDPHFVGLGALRRRAERAGFDFERHAGTRLGYVALVRKPGA
jgi:ubiquinone/menaquinone biosynthesis C-methylase UbiE